MNEVVERRLELLKLEAMGYYQAEIVKELSVKWHKTERTIYYDFETRETWQPLFSQYRDMNKARLVILNRLDYIYRRASLEKDSATMLNVTKYLAEVLGIQSVSLTEASKQFQLEAERLLNFFTKLPIQEKEQVIKP